jgi:plastocyanin
MLSSRAHRQTRSFVAAGAALAAMFLVGGAVAVAATRAVAISGFAFSPSSLTINVGDRVTWTNSDAVAHTATATGGAFDTGDIGQGQSASVRFTKAGTYAYYCTPHPSMTGTVRVRAASGGGTPTIPPTDRVAPVVAVDPDSGAPTLAWLVLAATGLLVLAFTVPRGRRSD